MRQEPIQAIGCALLLCANLLEGSLQDLEGALACPRWFGSLRVRALELLRNQPGRAQPAESPRCYRLQWLQLASGLIGTWRAIAGQLRASLPPRALSTTCGQKSPPRNDPSLQLHLSIASGHPPVSVPPAFCLLVQPVRLFLQLATHDPVPKMMDGS